MKKVIILGCFCALLLVTGIVNIYINNNVANEATVNIQSTANFFSNYRIKIKFKTFDNIIQIKTGELYNLHQVTQTYKALNNLKIYNSSNIDFEPVENNNDSINLITNFKVIILVTL